MLTCRRSAFASMHARTGALFSFFLIFFLFKLLGNPKYNTLRCCFKWWLWLDRTPPTRGTWYMIRVCRLFTCLDGPAGGMMQALEVS